MPKIGVNTDNIYLLTMVGMAGMFFLTLALIQFYVRNQKRLLRNAEEKRQAELKHQKDLTFAIIQSQEEERKRIGRDLHDDVGAALSNLKLYTLQWEGSETVRKQIDGIIDKARNISHMLSPAELELLGLREALEEMCRVIHQSGSVKVFMDNAAGDGLDKIPYEKALALYRVFQELFTNTIRHAGATEVHLHFDKPSDRDKPSDLLMIRYQDNGKGLQRKPSSAGMGMQNMESRLEMIGATYELDTTGTGGFGIRISLPI
jgi:signal transduction histidine kinase